MVQKTDSEIATKKKVKGKVDPNKDAAGSSNSVIDLTKTRDQPDEGSTGGKNVEWTGGTKGPAIRIREMV